MNTQYKIQKIDHLGTFKVESGVIFVTDPCYSPDTWCTHHLADVENGEWQAEAAVGKTDWSHRVWELVAYVGARPTDWTKVEEAVIGVDSGQAGFFDEAKYPRTDEERGEYGKTDSFYGRCCEITLGSEAGVIPFGVVSSSGFGDGTYDLYEHRRDGKVVGLKLVFIDERAFEEEEYGEDPLGYDESDLPEDDESDLPEDPV